MANNPNTLTDPKGDVVPLVVAAYYACAAVAAYMAGDVVEESVDYWMYGDYHYVLV